jgi:hypothetical protein
MRRESFKASISMNMAGLRHNSTASSNGFLAFVGVGWVFACREKTPHQSAREHRAEAGAARFRPIGGGPDDVLEGDTTDGSMAVMLRLPAVRHCNRH